MLAIFKTGGKQYSAKAGQILKVEKLEGIKGDDISFTDILAISDDKSNNVGTPILKDASIKAKIVDQIRDKKIIVFKKRKRQNYRLTQGHRQYLTILKIESISFEGKTSKAAPDVRKTNKVENNKEDKVEKKLTEVVKKKIAKKSSAVKKKSVKKVVKKTTKSKEVK